MNWFDQAMADIGAAVDDAVEWVEDAAEDVGEALEDAAEAVGEFVEDVAEDIVEAAEDIAEWSLNVLDDYVFDPIDYMTGGAVDIDYDNGQFSAELDIGIASAGVSFGEQGFSTHAGFDLGLASGEISYDDAAGFAASGSIGVDWGPLPYASGHIEISPNGDVSIGGELQATLPLPTGSIDGHMEGEMYRRADGSWGAAGSTEIDVDTAMDDGTFSSAAALDFSKEGFEFASGMDAALDVKGAPPLAAHASADASAAIGDESIDFSAGTDAGFQVGSAAFDGSAEAAAEVGPVSDGLDVSAVAQQISSLAGSGELSEALGADQTGTTSADATALVESGEFDDFTTAIVNVELTEAAADDVWDDIGQ